MANPTLRSLLAEKTVFEGTIQVAIQGTAARVDDVNGVVTLIAGDAYEAAIGSPWGGVQPTMRHEVVSCLQWESERAFERGIATALVGACGARVMEVSSWEHLPPLVPHLFGGGYGRPKLLFCHPATASKLFMAAMADPMRMWLTPASPKGHAQYCGAEVFPSIHFPEDVLVLVQDGNEIGRSFIRDAGLGQVVGRVVSIDNWEGGVVEVTGFHGLIDYRLRPGHRPIRVGDVLTVQDVLGVDPPMRAGLLLNASALACVRLTRPPPKPISVWTRLRWRVEMSPYDDEPAKPTSKKPTNWHRLRENKFQ